MLDAKVRTLVLVVATAATACVRPPEPAPDLHIAASPRYPCQGDAVTLTFASNSLDRVDVTDARGQVVGEAKGPRGTITMPRIERAMLPLLVRASSGGATREEHAPGAIPLGVISGSTPTEIFPLE